jgi:hypothetical protein
MKAEEEKVRSDLRSFLAILLVIAILPISAGCGGSNTTSAGHIDADKQSSIRGEVIEVKRGAVACNLDRDLGTVLVEGARSSPVVEALLTVTKSARIIDRRSGGDHATDLDSVRERQTVEAQFRVVSSEPQPWRAEVEELVICP